MLVNLKSNRNDEKTNKPVVLLVHGMLDSGDAWILNTKEKSIGFILVDAGYDVWMANTRGNKYSTNHTTLDPSKDWEYWDHSLTTDVAKYDMPAFIDHILDKTNVQNMTIIGHSQAT